MEKEGIFISVEDCILIYMRLLSDSGWLNNLKNVTTQSKLIAIELL